MSYLVAKIELQGKTPKIPFVLLSIETVVVFITAYLLVQIFA
jgi:hypothetical protein